MGRGLAEALIEVIEPSSRSVGFGHGDGRSVLFFLSFFNFACRASGVPTASPCSRGLPWGRNQRSTPPDAHASGAKPTGERPRVRCAGVVEAHAYVAGLPGGVSSGGHTARIKLKDRG